MFKRRVYESDRTRSTHSKPGENTKDVVSRAAELSRHRQEVYYEALPIIRVTNRDTTLVELGSLDVRFYRYDMAESIDIVRSISVIQSRSSFFILDIFGYWESKSGVQKTQSTATWRSIVLANKRGRMVGLGLDFF